MINEERFWESAIQEAVRNDAPPDVTARVLTGLAQAPLKAESVTSPRGKLRVLRFLGELAVAAAVVFAIGWLTGILRMPESSDPDGGEPVEVAAAPDTHYELIEGDIQLQQGWLLVVTGTPRVRCGESVLEQVDGRVLVHASGVPTREQAEAVLGWLNANGLEGAMIMDSRRWAAGTMLAALVLSGSALLDGARIQSQEEPKTEAGRWFTVRTVMDIDKLPADAKLVRGESVSGAHLEFLASHEGIESIDFAGCENLRGEHIESLAAMKNLRTLELRGARWDGVPDYLPFSDMVNLKELAVDYAAEVMVMEGNWPPAGWDSRWGVSDSLSTLAQSGVRITLGNLSQINGEQLANIAEIITTLRELNLSNNNAINDADMKALAEHMSLQVLNLENCPNVTELGLAYLAKKNRLSSLRLSTELTEAILYQLSRMTNLETLELPYGISANWGLPSSETPAGERQREAFEQLLTLQKLKRFMWDVPEAVVAADFAALAKLKSLATLSLTHDWQVSPLILLEIAQLVPVATLEIDAAAVSIIGDDDWLAEEEEEVRTRFEKLTENQNVLELRLNLYTTVLPETPEAAGMLPALLGKFPAVKRVCFIITESSSINFFKQYAKLHLPNYQVEIVVG